VDRFELYADENKKSPALIMLMKKKKNSKKSLQVSACLVNFEQMLWWSAAEHINIAGKLRSRASSS